MRFRIAVLTLRALRNQIGFRRYLSFAREYLEFLSEYRRFRRMDSEALLPTTERGLYAILDEKTATMQYEPHYTYHSAWACRELARAKPLLHIDIFSSIAFVTMVPVMHYDFRMLEIVLPGLTVRQADLCALDMESNSLESVSCLHVLEHIGLGRYGDPLNPRGHRRAAEELSRVLAPGGLLLVAVPVGRSRVNFNAHRVYAFPQVLGMFPGLTLKSFSLIPDDYKAGMIQNPSEDLVASQQWGCGCFVFSKPGAH